MNDTIKPYVTTWDLIRCADLHFRCVIYGLGPYIADYPEQSMAAGTVYGWCVTPVPLLTGRYVSILTYIFRCDADPADLNGSPAELCTLVRFMELIESEDPDTLWFGHGIVPDFLVSSMPLPAFATNTGGKGWCSGPEPHKFIARKWTMYMEKTHPVHHKYIQNSPSQFFCSVPTQNMLSTFSVFPLGN